MKKLLLVCLCLLLSLSSLACSNDLASVSGGYVLVGDAHVVPEYVLEINGERIGYAEFRYTYLLMKANAIANLSLEEAAAYWTEENEKKLLDDTIEAIRFEHAFLDFAARNNIALTEEQQKSIDTSLENAKKAYGEESLLKQLQSMYIADYDFYRVLVERETLTQGAIPDFFYGENGTRVWDDAKVREEYHKNYLRAKHILIQFVSGENKDNCPETLKKINAVYEELQNGADFDQLIKTYGQDPGMSANPDGYTFAEGTMVTEFYEGTLALEMNTYSQPVKTSYGFHIILRLPLSEENWDELKEDLLFGSEDFSGFYREDFQEHTAEISAAYQPEIKINPVLEGQINHDSVF